MNSGGGSTHENHLDDHGPPAAARISSYAIAAFVLSIVAVYKLSFDLLPSQSIPSLIIRSLVALIVAPVGAAGTALWLSARANAEIRDSRGRLGGSAFSRAARVLAIVVLVSVPLDVILEVMFAEDPQSHVFEVPGSPETAP